MKTAHLPILSMEEVKFFVETYPQVEEISLLCVDMLGLPKGKQIQAKKLKNLTQANLTLPKSILLENSLGENFDLPSIDPTDPDYLVYGISGTLHPSLWSLNEDKIKLVEGNSKTWSQAITRAHVMVGVLSEKGNPFLYGGRDLVIKMAELIKNEFKLTVSTAIELEFYLFRESENGKEPVTHLYSYPSQNTSSQCYGIDQIENIAPLTTRLRTALNMQGMEVEGISSEYGKGQYEINIKYRNNPVQACDDAILLKHSLKALAKPFGVLPTFMAVPNRLSANGMHINFSLQDEDGNQVLANKDKINPSNLSNTALNVIGGLEQTLEDAMLLFAPNPNSYKRYYAQAYSPTNLSNWGVNNRTVAIRLPQLNFDDPDFSKSMRIEQRVAGADSNPYLAVAAVLGGIYHGLKNKIKPNKMETGNAYLPSIWKNTPPSMALALKNWNKSNNIFRNLFGEDFTNTYYEHRFTEWYNYMGIVSTTDFDWYFHY